MLRARRQAQVAARCRAAESRVRLLQATMARAQKNLAVEPQALDVGRQPGTRALVDEQERWAIAAEQACQRAEARHTAAVAQARARRIGSALGSITSEMAAAAWTESTSAATPNVSSSRAASPTSERDWRDEIADSVRRTVEDLAADCPDSDAQEVAQHAEAVGRAGSLSRARQLVDVLGNEVGRINRRAAQQRRRRERLEHLLVQLDAWDDPTTDAAGARLRQEMDGGTTEVEQLEADIAAAVQKAKRAQDRAETARVLRQTLQGMGYVVEDGFDTLAAENGVAHVRRTTWSNHAVRVRLFEDRPDVAFTVLTLEGKGDAVRDGEVEREWCSTFHDMVDDVGTRGVALDITRLTDPGDLALQAVPRERFPFVTSRDAAGRDVAHARELERDQ